MIPVIGIHAGLQSGKSTVAKHLTSMYGYVEGSFADPIRKFISEEVLGISLHELERIKDDYLPEWNCSARHMMQTLGTDWGRYMVSPDIWTNIAERKLRPRIDDGGLVLFSDVRFENEADLIRSLGGQIWHLKRPLHLRHRSQEAHNHPSENGIEFRPDLGDKLITNEDTLQVLLSKVDELVKAA